MKSHEDAFILVIVLGVGDVGEAENKLGYVVAPHLLEALTTSFEVRRGVLVTFTIDQAFTSIHCHWLPFSASRRVHNLVRDVKYGTVAAKWHLSGTNFTRGSYKCFQVVKSCFLERL